MSDAAFRLSRIYAEGWNAARKLSPHEGDDMDMWRVSALNPYAAEPERTRWSEGFVKAIWNGLPAVQGSGAQVRGP
jgi:hypothetical protein